MSGCCYCYTCLIDLIVQKKKNIGKYEITYNVEVRVESIHVQITLGPSADNHAVCLNDDVCNANRLA